MLIQFCHLITVYHFKQLLTIFICTYFISTYAANLRIVVYYIYLRNFCGIVKFSYCCTLFYASLYPIVLLYLFFFYVRPWFSGSPASHPALPSLTLPPSPALPLYKSSLPNQSLPDCLLISTELSHNSYPDSPRMLPVV